MEIVELITQRGVEWDDEEGKYRYVGIMNREAKEENNPLLKSI